MAAGALGQEQDTYIELKIVFTILCPAAEVEVAEIFVSLPFLLERAQK